MIEDGRIDLDTDRGKLLGFTSDVYDGYLWKQDGHIIISFIVSLRRGGFKRLVDRILSLGLGVKVPTPLGRMKDIVRKNGYRQTFEDKDGERYEIWVLEGTSEC
jgi:hypothetical protein